MTHKYTQHNDELNHITITSHNISKYQTIIDNMQTKNDLKQPNKIKTYALNTLKIKTTKTLIHETKSQIIININSTFLNMSILQPIVTGKQIGRAHV